VKLILLIEVAVTLADIQIIKDFLSYDPEN